MLTHRLEVHLHKLIPDRAGKSEQKKGDYKEKGMVEEGGEGKSWREVKKSGARES